MIVVPQIAGKVNPLLKSTGEDVMGFLNEIQLKYPEAISFASGRPNEHYFDIQEFSAYFDHYVDTIALAGNKDRNEILGSLGQYNRTKGIINKEVAQYLQKDEGITADPADILITVGTQEALNLAVLTLCDRENDVIIVEDPTYVGITHFALIAGYPLEPVPVNESGMSLPLLEEKILSCRQQGKNVKLVYVIADYQNPTGNAMPPENRRRLLELAEQYDFYILEDNAYGDFSYREKENIPIKAMDDNKRVIYLRSFSKTLYPSLRLAAMVADQQLMYEGQVTRLSDLLAKTKGYTTVNTPSLNQAVFGGMLYKHQYSLKAVNKEKINDLKEKCQHLLTALATQFHATAFPGAQDISWNTPEGGFFITIRLPFRITKADVITCAEQYRVIFTPMSFFYLGEGGDQEIRLAFSNVSPAQIQTGIERLAQYLATKSRMH
ncbi:aminotransferase-like domain-containing protein [Chitinophaga nivalis]|uniref:PLP-dependent aminotransferase family protein n=1 Tax=Chitinophaga nivalis TaxID=2991709 RepID=A0ABT3IJP1_9BACT|nr:PLP-dependent aminotransferase family protein [Chitinophaga nivalis]MCW3466340.1 PLP-dependent aminotransferase family protein [Chitinophaga nivalis]MCW3483969.1 PLP-dependent aminotransferase family protein [Chitinophaga nivalis]